MKRRAYWLLPAVLVAGCSGEKEPAPAPQLTFHQVMADEIDPKADVIWGIGNAAIGEQAGINPAKMTDEDWDHLADGAVSLEQSVHKIATMDPLVIAKPGVKIADEGIPGGHTAAMVQARFDEEPEKLRDMANALAVHAADLARAAQAHDAARAGLLIDQLDGVCEACHLEFWYPDQKELVEKYINATS